MKKSDPTNLIDQVQLTVETHRMLSAGERVLVAVSGGPDSIALLHALIEIGSASGIELGVFHLNHALRDGAASEAEQVAAVADGLGLPSYLCEEDVGAFCARHDMNIQAGAREIRYRLMREVAREHGFQKIAVGHTSNDVVETFLMRLVRGSGPTGLSSIRPVRDSDIIRPLVEVGRDQILEWLGARNITFIEDPSNNDRKYFRNRIRHDLIPQLTTYNPRFMERSLATIQVISEEDQFIADISEELYVELAQEGTGEVVFDLAALRQVRPALGRRLLRRAVFALTDGLNGHDFNHIEAVWRDLVQGGAGAIDLPGEIRVISEHDSLVVYRPASPIPDTVVVPGALTRAGEFTISVEVRPREGIDLIHSESVICADAAGIVWPLTLRSAVPGDSFRPLGLGGTKKINEYLIDAKVPRRWRQATPVVADVEKVVAVGLRIDDRVKLTDATENVAIIETVRASVFEPG